jgi:hypothetical protein
MLNDITSVMKSDMLMFVILFSIQKHMLKKVNEPYAPTIDQSRYLI